jgi:hypothetical protein
LNYSLYYVQSFVIDHVKHHTIYIQALKIYDVCQFLSSWVIAQEANLIWVVVTFIIL